MIAVHWHQTSKMQCTLARLSLKYCLYVKQFKHFQSCRSRCVCGLLKPDTIMEVWCQTQAQLSGCTLKKYALQCVIWLYATEKDVHVWPSVCVLMWNSDLVISITILTWVWVRILFIRHSALNSSLQLLNLYAVNLQSFLLATVISGGARGHSG
jgi:hypothetical protein